MPDLCRFKGIIPQSIQATLAKPVPSQGNPLRSDCPKLGMGRPVIGPNSHETLNTGIPEIGHRVALSAGEFHQTVSFKLVGSAKDRHANRAIWLVRGLNYQTATRPARPGSPDCKSIRRLMPPARARTQSRSGRFGSVWQRLRPSTIHTATASAVSSSADGRSRSSILARNFLSA
jgi:hypothetical protein